MPNIGGVLSVASLGLVSPGAATYGVTHIFPLKNWRPFLVIDVCKMMTFLLSDLVYPLFFLNATTFLKFHSGVTPWRVSLVLFIHSYICLKKTMYERENWKYQLFTHISLFFKIIIYIVLSTILWNNNCEIKICNISSEIATLRTAHHSIIILLLQTTKYRSNVGPRSLLWTFLLISVHLNTELHPTVGPTGEYKLNR